jgi:hypothetical protein
MDAVIADNRWSIFGDRAAIRLIAILPGKIDDIESKWTRSIVHTEVIPIRLAIPVVLIRFAFDGQAKMGVGNLLYLAKGAALEIGMNSRRGQRYRS